MLSSETSVPSIFPILRRWSDFSTVKDLLGKSLGMEPDIPRSFIDYGPVFRFWPRLVRFTKSAGEVLLRLV